MSLDVQVQNKAFNLASQQAATLSVLMAADLAKYQTSLVNQFAAIGITLSAPMSFTQPPVIATWLLPQLQSIFLAGITTAALSSLNTAGLSQTNPSS